MKGRADRWAFGLTAAAFAWGLALVGAALVVPFYSGTEQSSSGSSVATSSTLVEVNGVRVLLVVAVPVVLTAVAWLALHRRCSRGSRRATQLAWTMVYALAWFAIVGAASIGLFVLPVAAMLGAAAALTPAPEG